MCRPRLMRSLFYLIPRLLTARVAPRCLLSERGATQPYRSLTNFPSHPLLLPTTLSLVPGSSSPHLRTPWNRLLWIASSLSCTAGHRPSRWRQPQQSLLHLLHLINPRRANQPKLRTLAGPQTLFERRLFPPSFRPSCFLTTSAYSNTNIVLLSQGIPRLSLYNGLRRAVALDALPL